MAGLDDARAYMAKREIPQLFESLMTALMYKKPDDHIKFLEECLSKAEKEKKIQWHTFIEPLPPIPKDTGKIQSEQAMPQEERPEMQEEKPQASPVLETPQPLPPIAKKEDGAEVDQGLNNNVNITSEQSSEEPLLEVKSSENDHDSASNMKLEKSISIEDDKGLEEKGLEVEEVKGQTLNEVENVLQNDDAEKHASVKISVPILFVLGGPGCGKGTQCSKVSQDYGFTHLSAGDLLRKEIERGTERGSMIAEIIKEGQLVPQEITIELLENAMMEEQDAKGFLIDGFPREISQGKQFEEQVKDCTGLLMFDCDDSVLVERLLKRAETSGRTDDNEETIKKRLALFHEKTMPMIDYYEDKVKRFDASGTIDEVYDQVKSYIDQLSITDKELSEMIDDIANIEIESKDEVSQEKDAERENIADIVEEDTIAPQEEVVIGNRGFTTDFAKQVLQGKEVIFVIGGPGCGKGTQSKLIVDKFGHKHLSLGDLLRGQVASGSELGNMLQEFMKKGELVPNNLIMRSLVDALIADENATKFLIDGFPRSLAQAEEFEKEIAECHRVLYFSCPNDVMVERLLKRAEMSGRVDDNEETIKNRLEVFQNEICPIIEYFTARNKLSEISAVGTPEEIFETVCKELELYNLKMDAKEQLKDTNIVFVLGGPGSGKGTQCERIVAKYGFCHLSTGDLLREEVQSGSKRAEALKAIMEKGELVSQDTILELLSEAMIKNKDAKGFLVDGFPRDVPQGQKFENEVGTCNFILYFDCSNECMTERLLGRAKTSGRVDDNEETIKKRLKTFEEQTLPVLDVYGGQNKVQRINAERGIDEIFTDVCVAMETLK
ncbi:adenylate kinase isoenzyme 5-like [Rhopilema esculentum]|uniref:adenylate kinase isoenzyme 5-like n=1 Tax=Rhopilema esculentum TaxID=499914 RepID=UPI0031D1C71E